MRIGRPLLKLPIRFCGDTLANEVNSLPAEAWMAHPQKFDGNVAVPLVSPGGELVNGTSGPMAPTSWLNQCPYVLEAMASLQSTWGRSRLMGLEPGAQVPRHVDIHYYWRTHLRLHIPVITNERVSFSSEGETVCMRAGECWILDSFYPHRVVNEGAELRVHLVLDTVGSEHLWDLIEEAKRDPNASRLVEPGSSKPTALTYEQINQPRVMSPWEMRTHVDYIRDWTDPQPGRDEILSALDRFVMAWSGSWAAWAISAAGVPHYVRHIQDAREALSSLNGGKVIMRNGRQMLESVDLFILANAISPEMVRGAGPA